MVTQSSPCQTSPSTQSSPSTIGYGNVSLALMQQTLAESQRSGRSLTDILEALTGQLLSPQWRQQFKRRQMYELKLLHGVECVNLETSFVSLEQVKSLISTTIFLEDCRDRQFIPLACLETTPVSVVVAMVNPSDEAALLTLKRLLSAQGFKLQRRVITQEDYQLLFTQSLGA